MREDRRLDNKDDGSFTISWNAAGDLVFPKEPFTYTFKFDDVVLSPSQSNTDETD